jgi:hypothetical protein
MHFVSCKIKLAGDVRSEVVRDAFDPVSYPEIEVIRFIHGETSVSDVKIVADAQQSAREEKERLALKYGVQILEAVFPGKNPQMELKIPGVTPNAEQVWRNPLDKEIAGYDLDPTIAAAAVKPKAKPATKDNPFAE